MSFYQWVCQCSKLVVRDRNNGHILFRGPSANLPDRLEIPSGYTLTIWDNSKGNYTSFDGPLAICRKERTLPSQPMALNEIEVYLETKECNSKTWAYRYVA
jgi:hypothetical protein